MLKFIKNICILLVVLVAADRILAALLEKMFYKQTRGEEYVSIQLMDKTNADILILGSSRASHHFVPDTLEAYTGATVFNGGRDNMGIHFVNASISEVLKRYTPKCIILDVIPYYFIKGYQDQKHYLDIQTTSLLPFANRHRDIFEKIKEYNPYEVYKARAIKMYAYNSLAGTIFLNSKTNLGRTQIKGYDPLMGKIKAAGYTEPRTAIILPESAGLDINSLALLEESVALCRQKNIKIVLCISPFYFPQKKYTSVQDRLIYLSNKYNCTLLDYTSDTAFIKKPELFNDELHLNNAGAVVLTKKLYSDAFANSNLK